jgi:hypothetical protein
VFANLKNINKKKLILIRNSRLLGLADLRLQVLNLFLEIVELLIEQSHLGLARELKRVQKISDLLDIRYYDFNELSIRPILLNLTLNAR